MNFEKIDNSLEKISGGNLETNFSQFEKNIDVEKPGSAVAFENSSDFLKNLEGL